jgi:hypothetical protein
MKCFRSATLREANEDSGMLSVDVESELHESTYTDGVAEDLEPGIVAVTEKCV